MTDTTTPAPSATPSTSTSNVPTGGKPVIAVPAGGTINRREIAKYSGHDELKDFDSNEVDDDADYGYAENQFAEEEENEEVEAATEEVDEENTEAEAEEETEDTDPEVDSDVEKIATKGKGIILKTADGKQVKLPKDAVILHKVDGELKEINLADAINREVGELTVEQRLSKVANIENFYKQEVSKLNSRVSEREEFLTEVSKLATSDKPEAALALIAELQGIPPGQIYKNFVEQGRKWAEHFAKAGLTPEALEAHWNKLDRDYFQSKLQKEKEAQQSKQQNESFARMANDAAREQGVTEAEFIAAAEELVKDNGYVNSRDDNDSIRITIEKALQTKHRSSIDEALKGTSVKDKEKLVAQLMKYTNPHEFSVEDLKQLVKEYLKSSDPKLSQKSALTGKSPAQKIGSRENNKMPVKVRSVTELKRAFGLSR